MHGPINIRFVEKIETHFMFNIFFFENRAVYEIMWKNTAERWRPQMTIWRIRIACYIPKATNTHVGRVCLLLFHSNSGFPNEPQCSVIRTLPVVFYYKWHSSRHWDRANSFCAIQYVNMNANKNLARNISFNLVCVDGYSLYEKRPLYVSYQVPQEVRLWIQTG